MHSFLKSIGFSRIHTIREQDELIGEVLRSYDLKKVAADRNNQLFAQISKDYAQDMGITVCGYYDDENLFHMEYYYPYFNGTQITSYQQIAVEKQAGAEAYAGACDDLRVGTTLIFYLLNTSEYLREKGKRRYPQEMQNASVSLSALSDGGVILLPLEKSKLQQERDAQTQKKRNSLYMAAANGDQDAIESLTMEDIDAYTMISRRIRHEDVYTIVDSYFMPYGLECDFYNIMGEITECREIRNSRTGEPLYHLGVVTNEIPLDICINQKDLTGVPQPGRRFKGTIWLQGTINF